MAYKAIRNIKAELLNLLYPQLCVGCNQSLHRNEQILCTSCFSSLPTTGPYTANNETEKLFAGRFSFEMAYSMLHMNKGNIAAKLLHELKYRGNIEIGEMLGAQMAYHLKDILHLQMSTVIVPVPLHSRKLGARGFNQSEVVAESLGQYLSIAVNSTAVVRTKHTVSQTTQSRLGRLQNTANAFMVASPLELQHKHVVLLDDVCTSGATIEACALAIKASCTCDISMVCAAIAIA
jgi:ComF family protein